jgi:MFS family permease
MNKPTDAAVSSYFSEEAEKIKRTSWTSLLIGLGIAIPCVFLVLMGFLLLFVAPLWGGLVLISSVIGFIVAVALIIRFTYLRFKLVNHLGSEVRESQESQ